MSNAQTVEVLIRAKDLLECGGWTKGAFARAENGRPIGYAQPNAVCFCSAGALLRAQLEIFGYSTGTPDRSWEALEENLVSVSISDFNDWPETTYGDVLLLFSAAIETAGTAV